VDSRAIVPGDTTVVSQQFEACARAQEILMQMAGADDGSGALNLPEARARPVRQSLIFPPLTLGIARRTGFVREYFLLIETAIGCVHHVCISCDYHLASENIDRLAEMLDARGSISADQEESAALIGYLLETTLRIVGFDLATPTSKKWPLRAAALQKCCATSTSGESPELLNERVVFLQNEIADDYDAALKTFVEKLDSEILALSPQLSGMPCERYNYFARAGNPTIRRYRLQAATAMPSLASALCTDNSAFTQTLTTAVDTGQPLAAALASACRVRLVTARHALTMPAHLVQGGDVPTLAQSLDAIVADHFPREQNEWDAFRRMVFEVIPNVTGQFRASQLNRAVLATISRRGWRRAEEQLSRLCVDDASAALFRDFLIAYRMALSFEILRFGACTVLEVKKTCNDVIDEALGRVGIPHLFEAAQTYPRLLMEVQGELMYQHEIQRGIRWHTVIQTPMQLAGCIIAPIEAAEALAALGRKLSNCLADYAKNCADGRVHVFSVHCSAGLLLGAVAFDFHSGRNGDFVVSTLDCKGHRNKPIREDGSHAVAAFAEWLKSKDAQARIAELRRMYFLVWQGEKLTIERRIAAESAAAALERLSHRALRFGALREHVLRILVVR